MKRWLGMTVLTVGLAAGPAAWGQVQSGQGGRALDANQQVGSGGLNTLEGQVDYRARNDIITGNVGGGRQFRDRVGYGAPGAFGLGGNSPGATATTSNLFNFERGSLASSPQRLNAVSVGANANTVNSAVFGTFTNVLPYQTDYRLVNATAIRSATGVQVVTDQVLNQVRIEAQGFGRLPPTSTIGFVPQPNGEALQVRATPLLGVRSTALAPRVTPPPPGGNPANPGGIIPDADLDADGNPVFDPSLNSELRLPGPNSLSSGIGVTGEFAESPGRIAPGLIIGQQLRLEVEPTVPDETFDQRAQRLEQSIFGRTASTQAQPGEDVYMDLLNAMRGQEGVRAGDVEGVNALTPELETPGLDAVEAAEQQRRDAIAQAYGVDGSNLDTPPAPGAEQRPADAEGPTEATPSGLAELLERLNYDLPQLETLAGSRENRVNRMLEKAEADLAGGRYFAAEGLYRQILTDAPDNPLGLAGLVHAQLGAGMIRSAAFNLRRLCEQHPELIAARYSANLLPAADRLKWVQRELQRMINDGRSPGPAGLMMAYLGYQVESPQLIRYGLAVAEASAPRDTLIPVLRAIWLDDTPASAPPTDRGAEPTVK